MGSDKALLSWPPTRSGVGARVETLLSATISMLAPHTQMVIVVAGKNAPQITPIADANAAFLVVNKTPERGQFSSLQVGLQEVLNHGRDAAIVALVDRPPARPETLTKLCETFCDVYEKDKWAVVPEFEGRHGHPIVIGREMITAFLAAPPESTARDVEHSLQARVVYVPVDDPNVVMNVNTPEDYARLAR
jgi:molybdenum cofactor cytidylyltransferase